ncbi:hypothetical protein BDZ85DRAFT_29750 [Elsinoe ampelina]|uniref:Uncharacterized protein n=1 Tax=Elsinoe ampelina TaxID=302913 RepID=A0A6A6G4I3_9PEZI|nr:hypothetical protein BDZ85DRAFT_29750 [Elsinoe ampelina]
MQFMQRCRPQLHRWKLVFPARRPHRHFSTPPPGSTAQGPDTTNRVSALARLQARLPPRLRPYLAPLVSAPVSHVTSFLILHELTALVPLAGFFALFHYSNAVWLERWRKKVEESENFQEGVKKWGRYARKKGWISGDEEDEVEREAGVKSTSELQGRDYVEDGKITQPIDSRVTQLEKKLNSITSEPSLEARNPRTIAADTQAGTGARIIIELATAYAITKVLLPARLIASIWATPWFARIAVAPISSLLRKAARR